MKLRPRTLTYAAMIVILLAAFLMRMFQLGSAPPALFYDQALNGLDILRVLRGTYLPIFFEQNAGREPLFIYFQALIVRLGGANIFSIFLASVFVSILSIAAIFVLARALTRNRNGLFIALIASAVLAASYWALTFSRIGLRLSSLPLFVLLTLYWFWRAYEKNRLRDWLITGILVGLTLYTYLSARLLPFILIAFLMPELAFQPRGFLLARLKGIAVTGLAALLVFAPLGAYFLTEPDAWSSRAQDIVLPIEPTLIAVQALGANFLRVAGMFFVTGDMEWRHNLAGRPVLDWLTVVPFLLGLALTIWKFKQRRTRLVSLWFLILLVPTILSEGAPDFARAVGALPATCLLIAWGWAAILKLFERVLPRQRSFAIVGIVLIALIGSGSFTSYDYFVRWANDRRTYHDYEGGINDTLKWINAQSNNIFIPAELYSHPTIHFFTQEHFPVLTSVASQDRAALAQLTGVAIPGDPSNTSGLYVLLHDNQAILLDTAATRPLSTTAMIQGKYSELAGTAPVKNDPFHLTQAPKTTPINARFGNFVLDSYSLPDTPLKPGARLSLTLYWHSTSQAYHEPVVFVQLVDTTGNIIVQNNDPLTEGISPLDWQPQTVMPDRHILTLPQNLPAGKYELHVGLYDPLKDEGLDVQRGGQTSDYVSIGPLTRR